jgi:hypothetical protein
LSLNKHSDKLEYDFYNDIVEATSSYSFAAAIKRLINKRLLKVRLPLEVREKFCLDIYELHSEKFGEGSSNPMLTQLLSSYYMQDDVRSGLSGVSAECGNFEYSFWSDRMNRRIVSEDYFKETSMERLAIPEDPYDLREHDGIMDIMMYIELSDLTAEELDILRLNAIEGYSVRDIAKLEGYPKKSSVGNILKSAKDKIKKFRKE